MKLAPLIVKNLARMFESAISHNTIYTRNNSQQ